MRTALLALAGLTLWVIDAVFVMGPAALGWSRGLDLGWFVGLLLCGAVLFVLSVVQMSQDQPRLFRGIGWGLFAVETVRHLPHRHHHR
jgi:hypothetical protein